MPSMSFMLNFGKVDEPNPEEAALCLGLASALLRDRQYKLGAEMMGHAMRLLEPQSLQQLMANIYRNVNDEVLSYVGTLATAKMFDTTRTKYRKVK